MADRVNAATIDLIKRNEGCELTAYPDPATGGAPWTIGYGHTGPDVYPGLSITRQQAEALLLSDLIRFEQGVDALLERPATPNQFGAMVSLAYNVGLGNFRRSSVLRHHNAGNYQLAADAFRLWNKAAGRTMAGLTRRREEERALYLNGEAAAPPSYDRYKVAKAIQVALGVPADGVWGPASRAAYARFDASWPSTT